MLSLSKHLESGDYYGIAAIESRLSIKESIESGVQINKFAATDNEVCMKIIVRLIENTAIFYNVKSQINTAQLVMTAQAIVDRYGYDNIEDVILSLKNGRAGFYGPIYGKFDGETVIGWMQKFMETKAEELEKMHHNNKHQDFDIAPEIVDVAKKFLDSRSEPPVVDAGSREAWVIDIAKNIDTMTGEQLRRLRTDLENDNIHGGNADLIALINRHL